LPPWFLGVLSEAKKLSRSNVSPLAKRRARSAIFLKTIIDPSRA
jgi:hypothetical protein